MKLNPTPSLGAALVCCCIGAPPVLARSDDTQARGEVGAVVESCVGSDRIEFKGADHAVLDADDLKAVQAAMLQQYPQLAQDGFPVSHIVMWQKADGQLLYVTLLADPEHARDHCYTATFAAARLAPTPLLRRKYFATR